MASVNKIMLVGRLTRDPEIRTTQNGLKMATFSIAVDRYAKAENGEKKTDFFRCKAWRQKADFVEEYVKKGRLVFIEGRVEIDKYTDKEGQTRDTFDIVVESVQPLESNRDNADGGGGYDGGNRGGASNSRQDDGGGNGYFPDDEPAPARPANRPAPVAAQVARPAQAPARPAAAPAPATRAAAPAKTYDEDFDDSDPFADE